MKMLLPHRFKTVGAITAPLGFALWILMQFGVIKKALTNVFGTPDTPAIESIFHTVNVVTAVTGFLLFLSGMYFLSFSREKVEDEMIHKVRLDSFQFAAFVQMVFICSGFFAMILFGSPNEGLLMLFFIAALFLFWILYIARFNIALIGKKEYEE
jgi:hypothetical protein